MFLLAEGSGLALKDVSLKAPYIEFLSWALSSLKSLENMGW